MWLPSGKSGKGIIKMPYISDENDHDDFEVQITLDEPTNDTEKLKDELRSKVISILKEQVSKMLTELKDVTIQKTKLPQKPTSAKILDSISPLPTPQQSTKTQVKSLQLSSFTLKEKFVCSRKDLFECLLLPNRVKAFAGGDAIISPEKGSKFRLFGGSVEGENLEVEEPKKIVQKWRFSSWPEGVYSIVTIELEEKDGKTILKLEQTGVPEEDKERTENGWDANFWRRIKGIFGYGPLI